MSMGCQVFIFVSHVATIWWSHYEQPSISVPWIDSQLSLFTEKNNYMEHWVDTIFCNIKIRIIIGVNISIKYEYKLLS